MKELKIILLTAVLAVLILCSCDRVLLPSGDITQTEIANVYITFDFAAQTITVHNSNKERAEVEIRRWNGDTRTYLKIFHESIGGYSELSREADFEHGDDIKIRIKIEGNEVTRYYTLGAPWIDKDGWLIETEPDWEWEVIIK